MSQTSHILVADDNLSAREVLRGLLTKFGYELTFATNGQEALAEAKRIVPDVILLDVMMPGLTGFQVCERIRSDAQLAEVPILLITALDDRESRLQGIKAGADDFISKPFDPVELSARVQTILQLNRYRRLHTERSKFEWVVEQSGYGYLILNRQQVITYANTQARQYLGLPENSEVSSSLPFLSEAQRHFHCEPEDVWQTWPNLPDSTPAYLVRPATDEADSFWLQVEQMEMVGGGDQKYLIHLRDVTEEINNRRLTWTFQSQVGHKLRTPSMLITGFLDVMLEDETLSKEQHVHLKSIYNNALRLQEGIQDILEYLDVPHSARHGEPIYRLSEMPPLVEKIQTDLGLASVTTQLPAEAEDLAGPLPLTKRAMELILSELLENSKKFHPSQTPVVEVAVALEEGYLKLWVQDNGLHLPPDQLHRMWLPYYQIEKYFTGQVTGMGLGLAIVAGLVWDVGGSFRTSNRTDGPGLIVELTLPLIK